jgi:prevent-host-death family protein
MRQVTARDANQRFSEILSAVETGEEVTITKRGRPVAVMSPYRPPALTPERQAAIERAIAIMDEPVALKGEFRGFSRDEMHERS